MGITDFYDWPYPDPTTPVDVPRDIKALADKLELLKNGFTVPTGHVIVGDLASATQYRYYVRRLDAANAMECQSYIMSGGAYAQVLFRNGVEVNRMRYNYDGSVAMSGGPSTSARPLPYAVQAAFDTIVMPNAAVGTKQINFASGRFSETPVTFVMPTGGGSSVYAGTSNSNSAASSNVVLRHLDATVSSATIAFNLLAVQMLPTGGVGRAVAPDPPTYPTLSTCHTAGCENEGIPIPGGGDIPNIPVACAPCGQPVTDVVPVETERRRTKKGK